MSRADKIRAVLVRGVELSSAEIAKQANLWSGTLYPLLSSMEKSGILESRWEEGPKPRRRLYRLVLER